jgi:radical SAM protein with 4Fe4S-binding SPASM domain
MSELQECLYGSNYEVESFAETFYDNIIVDNCMFGIFAVASNGDVYFCAQIGDLVPIANIRTTSFAEICNESFIAEKATTISNLKPCNECELKYICGGGCRIKEFPMLTQRSTFAGFNPDNIPPRQCSMNVKNKFYDLMIRSNRYLFKPIV